MNQQIPCWPCTMSLAAWKPITHIWDESKKLLVVGNAKTYFHITSLVSTYTEEFENFVPFPGDWHLLESFQPVLMKVFFDAGLKQLAETSGYCWETRTSLGTCSNLKRTNSFLLQLHEALLRQLISTFTKAATEVETASMPAVLNEVVHILQKCTKESNTTISKSS